MYKRITGLMFTGLLFTFIEARGTTLNVPGWYPTIQSAIDAAVNGDTVLVAPGTYVERIDFKGKSIRVVSEEGMHETTIDGNEMGSVVTFMSGEDENSILDGFTILHGYANFGGGMYIFQCSPTIQNCTFTMNAAQTGGAGMYSLESSPIVNNCFFKSNHCNNVGGGVLNDQSALTMTSCSFSHNDAEHGGGMMNYKASCTMDQCTFSENRAYWMAGGLLSMESDMTLNQCTLSKNTAEDNGGGMIHKYDELIMTECKVEKNTSGSYGGGLDLDECKVTLTNCTFDDNSAWRGGGVATTLCHDSSIRQCTFSSNNAVFGGGLLICVSDLEVSDSAFSTNIAEKCGAGMMSEDNTNSTVIDRCQFIGNQVTAAVYEQEGGGGIYNIDSSPAISNCIFKGNQVMGSWAFGGGVYNLYESHAVLSNCIFFDNEAVSGGGICHRVDCDPSMINCTLYDNQADTGGGVYTEHLCNPTVINSILWDNNAQVGQEIAIIDGTFFSTFDISYSDVRGGASSVYMASGCTLNWGVGMLDADPRFVDQLGEDCHLSHHSPCRDAGNNAAAISPSDFEGDPRITGNGVDMGADEFHTHLYFTGDATPGGTIEIKLVGQPGTNPVYLWVGSGMLTSPIFTNYGDWYLELPVLLALNLGTIPSPKGVLVLPITFDLGFPAADIPLQALIGPELTNPCDMRIE